MGQVGGGEKNFEEVMFDLCRGNFPFNRMVHLPNFLSFLWLCEIPVLQPQWQRSPFSCICDIEGPICCSSSRLWDAVIRQGNQCGCTTSAAQRGWQCKEYLGFRSFFGGAASPGSVSSEKTSNEVLKVLESGRYFTFSPLHIWLSYKEV